MKKIVHVITSLGNGGAEGVLYRLCTYDKLAKHIVISMIDEGKYGSMLKASGVDVYCLNMSQSRITFSGLWRLFKLLKQYKPDVVQTWMYHADLIGGLTAKLAGVKSVFWNIRSSDLDRKKSKKSTWLVAKLCAKLSYVIPRATVCCAQRAKDFHISLGYKNNIVIIGNGYDLSVLQPSSTLKDAFRCEVGARRDEKLIGMVARYDPQKDHLNLLQALSIVMSKGHEFKCCLVGKGLNNGNSDLKKIIQKCNLENHVVLLDQRSDITKVMNGLDLHVLSSAYGEAFPNVVAEAMSCGTPNIVTDVGDAAYIVGETGRVVNPRSCEELAEAISEVFEIIDSKPYVWDSMCVRAFDRAQYNFDINLMIEQFHEIWSFEK